jgi:5'-nucleotidase
MAAALQRVQDLRATPLDVVFDTPVPRGADDEESALGNLFADALRDLTPGTDVAVSYSAGPGGLRADIAAGPATFGALYDVFPFDNRVVRLTLTGAQLRQMLASQLRRPRARGRALGVSGIRVRVDCRHNDIAVDVTRESGRPIGDHETLVVATTDFMVLRAASVALIDAQAIDFTADLPLVRDAVAGWLREHGTRGGHLRADQFADAARPRWARTEPATRGCLPS